MIWCLRWNLLQNSPKGEGFNATDETRMAGAGKC